MNNKSISKRIVGSISPFIYFLFFTCVFLAPAWAYAQNSNSVTLNVQNENVVEVFNQIKKQTGLKFFYDQNVVSNVPAVSVKAKDAELTTVLNRITRQTKLNFERKGRTILVSTPDKDEDSTTKGKRITAKGTVKDSNGQPVIGAAVQVIGTSVGSITDIDGKFSIPAETGQTLLVSYIGYQSAKAKVTGKHIKMTLVESSIAVDEVVVTALGIKKEKKALAYSVSEIKGEDMNRVKVANLATGLSGKVAGVNVSKPSSGVMGSSRIIIRGNGSLNGSNQPLYIVDGMPIDNSNYGQAGMWGGSDGGDGISSINSEDIESMSVLKGGTAAALYGSRAANGAIVITTKSGSVGRVRVEYNLSYTNEILNMKDEDIQWEYGLGYGGMSPHDLLVMKGVPEAYIDAQELMMVKQMGTMSFGGKLDGSSVMQFNGERMPYNALGRDNFKNFYQNAWSLTNNVAVSGGSDKVQFRVAVGDQRFQDLMPNSKMGRNNITMSINSKLDEHLSIKANVMYVRERTENRPNVGDITMNANATLYALPANTDIRLLKGRTDENGYELLPTGTSYIQNPYFVAYDHSNKDSKDRIIGSIQAQYNFTPNWYLRGRFGGDMINRRSEDITPYGTGIKPNGSMSNSSIYNGEFNAEAIAGYTNTFKDNLFSVDAFVGWNTMGTWYNETAASGENFIQPEFNAIGNTGVTKGRHYSNEKYINSLFAQAEFSYKSMLYLTLTGRNDWFSALSYKGKTSKNNIFYPSVGMGFILSEAIEMPEWLPYLKLRGSWAESGGDIGAYRLGLTYGFNEKFRDNPIGSILPSIIPNMNLKPLTSISYEAGLEARFLNNRLGLDFTYYVRNTKNDIVDAGVSSASGYEGVCINAGKVHNHGVELLLTAVPVKTKDFTWNSSFNFSYNKSEVKRITDDIDKFPIETARTGQVGDFCGLAYIYQEVGQPYGIIKGTTFKRNDKGEIMYYNGIPMRDDIKKIGESVAPYTLGFSNSFSYKGINLSFLIDAKIGGDLFSMTNNYMYQFGRHKATLEGREGGVIGKGVKEDGVTPNDVAVPATQYYMAAAGVSEQFVYDASYVKLRELSLGYTFPKKIVSKMGMSALSVSLVGRNLWNIYDKVPLVDPEAALNNGNGQGFELYGLPATRSIGFNLNVKF